MNRGKIISARKILAILLLLVFITAGAGCGAVKKLRQAQDDFNQAAAAENNLRFDSMMEASPAVEASLMDLQVARGGYRSALNIIEGLSGPEKASLKNDRLLGDMYVIQALCLWRLDNYGEALMAANEAMKEAKDQLYARDKAVMDALPGLIKTDQAYDKILKFKLPCGSGGETQAPPDPAQVFDTVEELLMGNTGAIEDIEKAMKGLDEDHPLRFYFVQAQLAAYRNLKVAYQVLKKNERMPDTEIVDENDPDKKRLLKIEELIELQKENPAELLPGDCARLKLYELKFLSQKFDYGQEGTDLLKSWKRLLGVSVI